MLDATVMRQEAIASNLANLETPNYKRVDVDSDFNTQLSQAIQSGHVNDMSRIEPRIIRDRNAPAPNRDGNTVQLDNELINLQQNTVAHAMQTQFVSGALIKLRSAILGRNV